ncbi:hypothetical protein M8C21_031802 [Ambrosia artemisiifolia]|uniref:Uncharacterized protein n=1 Tax=Ambrosia artemisiifolia TaxID=4212 RepID=A0AAD5CBK1_AMBAR|nr:hypothetical protein M8C21_031802 [Ambrosia artemisiifolia]
MEVATMVSQEDEDEEEELPMLPVFTIFLQQEETLELKDTRRELGTCNDLNDMRKLTSNDEAFNLSRQQIRQIVDIIRSCKTPTLSTYMRWDQYAISFYLKLCTCFRVDYQHLESTVCPPSPEVMPLVKEQEEHTVDRGGMDHLFPKEMSHAERIEQVEHMYIGSSFLINTEPFKFGSYSSTPECIPYHLYLLVKEAVDIMKRFEWHNNPNDLVDLATVEKKISFFCTYLHSHLPTGWSYERDRASSVVAGYDSTRKPRYFMAGYTPIRDWVEDVGCDEDTYLTPQELMDIMSILHSRKTPTFWNFGWQQISFYCKLCSCFGIDYHCLEAASEDDVCLMNMGRNG